MEKPGPRLNLLTTLNLLSNLSKHKTFLKNTKRSRKTRLSLVATSVILTAAKKKKKKRVFPFLALNDLLLCRFVYLELPAAAKTPCTRFRWWQPVFSGEDYDQWAVDDIIILSEKQKQIIPVVNPTLPQVFLIMSELQDDIEL